MLKNWTISFYLLDILSYAEALYDFQGNSPNMLTLHKGDHIAVLDKAGNQKGWWKGKIDKNVNIYLLLQNNDCVVVLFS